MLSQNTYRPFKSKDQSTILTSWKGIIETNTYIFCLKNKLTTDDYGIIIIKIPFKTRAFFAAAQKYCNCQIKIPLPIKIQESPLNVVDCFKRRLANHHQIILYYTINISLLILDLLEFDILFCESIAFKFFGTACLLKFSLITNQIDAPIHHNIGFLSFYEIMSLANFEILSSWKFKNKTL